MDSIRRRQKTLMDIITLTDLANAIANRVGIKKEKAWRIAGFVLDLFGYDDRIIDNVLDPEDRQLFYILESEGMLTTGREVTMLNNGREWLTHYWQLKKKTILKYAREENKRFTETLSFKRRNMNIPKKNIYSTLSEEVWTSRRINRKGSYL